MVNKKKKFKKYRALTLLYSQNDQEYIEELHSREEQDNTPKYPMYLPQKTIPTDQNSLSAV